MKSREFCEKYRVALLLLLIAAWTAYSPSVSSKRIWSPETSKSSVTLNGRGIQNEELCSVVVPKPATSTCSGVTCTAGQPVMGNNGISVQTNSSRTAIFHCHPDVQQVISTKDTESKTKVPEILHDPRLGTTFYDCPGFSDTNSTDELTNAYFIKHALDSSKKAKFILVAPQHTLETAGSRHYFSRLLLHTVKTIKNVEKYVESFALAVTFANPAFSQERLVKNVAGYLKVLLDEELDEKFQGQGEILRRVKALVKSLLGLSKLSN